MDKTFRHVIRDRKEISVRYDYETKALWAYSNPTGRPCYTIELLTEYRQLQWDLIDYYKDDTIENKVEVNYFVNASLTPDIYSYGGDLNLFIKLIEKKDRETLYEYGKISIDSVYLNMVNLNLPLTTISLVEGTALGGGFENALSCNVCIAEEQVEMGLPEIRFNLIPGMGAYSFLARRIGTRKTEDMLYGGRLHEAQELYDMGVIGHIAKAGEAEATVNKFMKKSQRFTNSMQAINATRQRYESISYDELLDILGIWADAALRLGEKDIKMMKKLVEAQDKKDLSIMKQLRTKQDRRIQDEGIEGFFAYDEMTLKEDRRKGESSRR